MDHDDEVFTKDPIDDIKQDQQNQNQQNQSQPNQNQQSQKHPKKKSTLGRTLSVRNLIDAFEKKSVDHPPRLRKRSKSLGDALKQSSKIKEYKNLCEPVQETFQEDHKKITRHYSQKLPNQYGYVSQEKHHQHYYHQGKHHQNNYLQNNYLQNNYLQNNYLQDKDPQPQIFQIRKELQNLEDQLGIRRVDVSPIQDKIINLLFKIGMTDSEGSEQVKEEKKRLLKRIQELYSQFGHVQVYKEDNYEGGIFEDEIFEDEIFENEILENEILENEILENEIFENEIFQDENNNRLKKTKPYHKSLENVTDVVDHRRILLSSKSFSSHRTDEHKPIVHKRLGKKTKKPRHTVGGMEDLEFDVKDLEHSVNRMKSSTKEEKAMKESFKIKEQVSSLTKKYEKITKEESEKKNCQFTMSWVQQPGHMPRMQFLPYAAPVDSKNKRGSEGMVSISDSDEEKLRDVKKKTPLTKQASKSSSSSSGKSSSEDSSSGFEEERLDEREKKSDKIEERSDKREERSDNREEMRYIKPKETISVQVSKLKAMFENPGDVPKPIEKNLKPTTKLPPKAKYPPEVQEEIHPRKDIHKKTVIQSIQPEPTNEERPKESSSDSSSSEEEHLQTVIERPKVVYSKQAQPELPKVSHLKNLFENIASNQAVSNQKVNVQKNQEKPKMLVTDRYKPYSEYKVELLKRRKSSSSSEENHYDRDGEEDHSDSEHSTVKHASAEEDKNISSEEDNISQPNKEYIPTGTPQNTENEGTEDEEALKEQYINKMSCSSSSSSNEEENVYIVTEKKKEDIIGMEDIEDKILFFENQEEINEEPLVEEPGDEEATGEDKKDDIIGIKDIEEKILFFERKDSLGSYKEEIEIDDGTKKIEDQPTPTVVVEEVLDGVTNKVNSEDVILQNVISENVISESVISENVIPPKYELGQSLTVSMDEETMHQFDNISVDDGLVDEFDKLCEEELLGNDLDDSLIDVNVEKKEATFTVDSKGAKEERDDVSSLINMVKIVQGVEQSKNKLKQENKKKSGTSSSSSSSSDED